MESQLLTMKLKYNYMPIEYQMAQSRVSDPLNDKGGTGLEMAPEFEIELTAVIESNRWLLFYPQNFPKYSEPSEFNTLRGFTHAGNFS